MKGGYLDAYLSPSQEVNTFSKPEPIQAAGDKVKAQAGIITPEIHTELRSHKAEILEVLREPTKRPATKVYHVTIDVDGVHKGMTVLDPSGDDLAAFRQSCYRRFGEERVISVEPRP